MHFKERISNLFDNRTNHRKTLDTVLCKLSPWGDKWTVENSLEGTLCVGETGSGKSSLLNELFLKAMLRQGMGGLLNVVKAGDGEKLAKIVRDCGRGHDLVMFNEHSDLSFSFLANELSRTDTGSKEIMNVGDLIMRVYRITKNYRENNQTASNDHFWEDSLESLIQYSIQLLILAKKEVSFIIMQDVILDLFSVEDVKRYNTIWSDITGSRLSNAQKDSTWEEYKDWTERNKFLHIFDIANQREDMTAEEMEMLGQVGSFFLKVFPSIGEKTKSTITQSFLTLIQPFQTGVLRKHFTEGVSDDLRLENCFEGKIIICDWAVMKWNLIGIYASAIMKNSFQMAAVRRIMHDNSKPAFLWIDEAQNLLTKHDSSFQLVAREYMIATTYISQSIPALRAALSKSSNGDEVKALLSNLGMKIFLSNSCPDTNYFASDLIGRAYHKTVSLSVNGKKSRNHNYSNVLRSNVPPETFAMLQTGGAPKYKIEAIMFKAGYKWKSGQNHNRAIFKQIIN